MFKTNVIEAELSYTLTGLCFKVQKRLDRFVREKQYCDEFEKLLKVHGIKYQREYEITKIRPDSPEGNRVDFLVVNKIILDFKAKQFITKADYS